MESELILAILFVLAAGWIPRYWIGSRRVARQRLAQAADLHEELIPDPGEASESFVSTYQHSVSQRISCLAVQLRNNRARFTADPWNFRNLDQLIESWMRLRQARKAAKAYGFQLPEGLRNYEGGV